MTTTPATLQNLLDQMQNNVDVLNDWDVVVNLLVEPVNRLFDIIYRDAPQGTWSTIDVAYCQVVPNPSGDGDLVLYTDLAMTLANPSLEFGADNNAFARITFSADGALKRASAPAAAGFDPATDCNAADPSLDWTTTALSSASFVATVPLTVLDGRTATDSHGFRVVLNFPAGSFEFPELHDAPDPTRLTTQLQGYFASHDVEYVLNEVDTQVVDQLPALTPKTFKLNALTTNTGKNILQFFVTTIGSEPSNLTVNVNEPIPDGSQCTIMIRQGIAQQLGGASLKQVSLFAIENLAFPGTAVLEIKDQYTPKDMLVTADFDLADSLVIVDGNGQHVVRSGNSPEGGTAEFGPLTVKALDALGNVSAGTPISFAPGTHPTMMAVQLPAYGSNTVSVTTGADGTATLAQTNGQSVSCYYASGPFQIVATAPGGKTATFDLTVDPTPPPPDLPNAVVTVVSGNGQSVARTGTSIPGGRADFAPLQVAVKDPNGIAIPNAEVQWAPGNHPQAMAVQVTPSGVGAKTTLTDGNGVATLDAMGGNSVSCYYAQGALQVVASVPGGGSATFDLTVAPAPPPTPHPGATVSIVAGNGQSAARGGTSVPGGIAHFAPLQVLVKDADGNVAPNIQVQWAAGSHPQGMAVQLDPFGTPGKVTPTDGKGMATLNSMNGSGVSCYYADGAFQVVASVPGGGSATFDLTVTPAPPPTPHPGAIVTIVAGDNQSAARQGGDVLGGQALFAPMQVVVRDAQNNPLVGVPVDWTSSGPSGMAVQVDPSGGSPATVISDGNGMATLNRMPGGHSVYCYYATGGFTVTAAVNGGGSATFHGTVTG